MESQDGGRNGSRTQAEKKLFDVALAGKRSGLRGLDRETKKALPWTEEEHRLFLLGLKKYGKGDWRNISREFVITRTPTQVASHAQKYFINLKSNLDDNKKKNVIVTRSRL